MFIDSIKHAVQVTYEREPEGYMSWQHLTFATVLIVLMVVCAILIGKAFKNKSAKAKNNVMIWTAILIDTIEIIRVVIACIMSDDAMRWLYELPLFLCSIQFITIPLAAFSKGRVKQAALDFVFIFGILSAVMGVYFAGQNFNAYPVLSVHNVANGLTHTISGFASLYIVISGMESMQKKNLPITYGIMLGIGVLAYVANHLLDYNYMFLMRGDGTPYDILYNLFNGNVVLYPLSVILLFVLYIYVFNLVYHAIKNKRAKANSKAQA
ncbi:MAG: YwaF family protein [Clostridia bacterium]|nr:YwaF family protein [Clostridia bacterium]